MPARLNVGLSRQVGEGGPGGRTASIHIELEIEPGLVNDPARMQEHIRTLFATVRSSLSEELEGHNARPFTAPAPTRNGNSSPPQTQAPRAATQSQAKALYAIARSQQIDLATFLQEQFQVQRPADLTIQEASQAIDALKAAPAGKGG